MNRRTWPILDLIRVSADFLTRKGIDSPRLTAELLLAETLRCPRIELYTRFDRIVQPEPLARFRELIRRRATRTPTQYLLGRSEFMSLEFAVNEHVLVPRPETEILVEAAQRRAEAVENPVIADLGTGCGNIAIALAQRLPQSYILLCDVSEAALEVARVNAQKHNVHTRAQFLHGDLFAPLERAGWRARLDIIVSNPPYVADDEFPTLQPEVRDHEPRVALAGGPDGLDFYRGIVARAPEFLKPDGFLLLELPDGKGDAIRSLLTNATDSAAAPRFHQVETIEDHNRITRVLVARTAAAPEAACPRSSA